MDQITVTVKLFAIYREVYGVPEVRWTFAAESPVAVVLDRVLTEYPQLEPWRDRTQLGVNLQVVSPTTPMAEGDEVVLIPPINGG